MATAATELTPEQQAVAVELGQALEGIFGIFERMAAVELEASDALKAVGLWEQLPAPIRMML